MQPQVQIGKWLKKLEQESWQLELLVSGFTIFLLITAFDGLTDFRKEFQFHFGPQGALFGTFLMFLYVVAAGILVLIVNLVLHLALRGFWIGAIGLRSVGPHMKIEELKYHEFFEKKLKNSMVNIDDLIVRLDRLCSVIFSLSFLIIFMFLSFFVFILVLAASIWALNGLISISPEWLAVPLRIVFIIVFLFFVVGGLLYLLDTLSLGILKKVGWLRRVYFPVYVFFSTITLSFLYRSIYYNLIAKFNKGLLRIILIVYVLVISFFPFFEFDDYRYFPDNTSANNMERDFYDDQRPERKFIYSASIPSMTVTDSYISLFIRYSVGDNPALEAYCPDFVPAKKGGIKDGITISDGNFTLNAPDVEEPYPEKALECLKDFYAISIDSREVEANKAYFYIHPNREEKGLLMMVSIEKLTKGAHSIGVQRRVLQDSVLQTEEYANIPFWRQ